MLQLLQDRPLTFGDELDRAVIVVAHPSAKAQLLRLALDEVAKADALHIPPNQRVQALHAWIDVSNCTLVPSGRGIGEGPKLARRSEEHTSELHHLVISYAVFCLKKKKTRTH